MTARSIRRAAERKAKKLARKAEIRAAAQPAAPAVSNTVMPEPAIEAFLPAISVASPAASTTAPECVLGAEASVHAPTAPTPDYARISPAQLAANRANSQLSTGPRSAAGLARSSKNAVKSALTGRTVLLPADDVEEYASFLAGFQHDLKPVGQMERELVQIIADCHWRLRRIQELEYALYAHGERQFAEAFADEPDVNRHSMTILQTHLTYQKELRNLHIQEARIDRKRAKALNELAQLQAERRDANADDSSERLDGSELEAERLENESVTPNGFVFSNTQITSSLASPIRSGNGMNQSEAA